MNIKKILREEISKQLTEGFFHGTANELIGTMSLDYNNSGVASNDFTLGKGIYITTSINAAKLFSHVHLQNKYLKDRSIDSFKAIEMANNAGIGNIYDIELKPDIKILYATNELDRDKIYKILYKTKRFREDTLKSFYNDLDDLNVVVNLLNRIEGIGNPYEFLTKTLGYDALEIYEQSWNGWDYFPDNVMNYNEFITENPITIVVYNTDKIKSYKKIINGIPKEKNQYQ